MPKLSNKNVGIRPPVDACAWCGSIIPESSMELHSLLAKARLGYDISPFVGTIRLIKHKKNQKIVPVIFVTEDSEAKKEGWDMAFMLCSQKCYNKLRKSILDEKKYIVN